MLQFTPQMKLLLAIQPADFRKGIDGLSAICQSVLQQDPFSGTVFVFTNRRQCSVKLLTYDGQGFWLAMKRFSKGKLKWWPKNQDDVYHITACELQILLQQGQPKEAQITEDWKPLR